MRSKTLFQGSSQRPFCCGCLSRAHCWEWPLYLVHYHSYYHPLQMYLKYFRPQSREETPPWNSEWLLFAVSSSWRGVQASAEDLAGPPPCWPRSFLNCCPAWLSRWLSPPCWIPLTIDVDFWCRLWHSTTTLQVFINWWGYCLRVAISSTLVCCYWCISILIIIPVVRWCSLMTPHKSAVVLFDRGYL